MDQPKNHLLELSPLNYAHGFMPLTSILVMCSRYLNKSENFLMIILNFFYHTREFLDRQISY